MPIKIATVQTGLEQSIQRAVRNVNARGGLNIAVNDRQFTGPLGKITGSVSEFNKSLEASNARVIAFGASVGIIQGVQKALAGMVTSAIEVEKKLTEINVVMGLTTQQLNKFGDDLFKVAKNTAQSFSTVATAATELARQGLTMEETLKRTNDALILTRLTGLDAESAVSGLTAALNTFNKAGLDSTKILSKMAAVDVQFAVSTEDLIDAVSRAGAVAKDAGVSFDQLLGAVTAAQQMTARGGKVIGNSFKTIFTRVQRSSTIQRLEELGIAVRDVAGNTLPAISVLQNLAQTYDTLADTTKAAVAEQVGGVFQINILKAAIKDLADQNSILTRATQIASQATDEAYKKNEILNRSLAALTSQTATSVKELASILGELTFADGVTDALNVIKSSVEQFSNFLGKEQGESAGADFAQGLLKGIGKALTGPGLLIASALLLKLFGKTLSFLKGSAGELLGVVSASQKQKQIQESIVAVLSENSNLQKRILSQEGNRAAQEKTILSILQAQTREQQKISAAARAIAPGIAKAGYNAGLTKTRSEGHVPNYVKPQERFAETRGAIEGGYKPGLIKSMKMPGLGRVIYNSAEEVKKFPGMREPAIIPPHNSKAGKKYKSKFEKAHGFDPYKNKGHVPEFSKQEGLSKYISQSSYIKFQKNHEKSIEKKVLSGGGLESTKNLKFGDLPASKFAKASELYYKNTPQNQRVSPEDLPNTFVDSNIKNSLNLKKSFVPNFNPLRINSKAIKTISSTAKIREDGFDGRIGMSKLLEILSGRLFTSIKYRPKKSDEGFETLFLSGARSGVHKYKKGAPPPKGYNSWRELDEATGTKVVHANSVGVGEKGFRRLKLKRVESIVSRGKHYEVDHDMAALGHIPNFARAGSIIKASEMGGYGGSPKQVEFSSNVSGVPFTKAHAMEIPDPKNSRKPGLQVIHTLDSNPDLRGKGYGRELYEYMAKYAKKNGYAGLYGDMGTSISAMRVIDSIAKRGKVKVEKNKDLRFIKDDFETEGMWGSDSWTYKLSNKGIIPNYALMGAPVGINYLSGLRDINPQIYSDSIIDRAEILKDEQKRNAALLEISKRPNMAVKSLQYLDNSGLEKIKAAMIADRALGGSDWTYVKSGVGKVTSADVSKDLSRIPAKEIFNYLTGKTDRIQGSVPGHFIRLLDHSDRTMQARDIVGSSQRVTKAIKQQIAAIRKSPKRRSSVMDEVLNKDVLKLGYDPLRGQSMAQRRSNELRQKFGMGGALAQMYKPASSFSGSSAGFGKFGDQTLNNILSNPKSRHIRDLIDRTNVSQKKINLKALAGQLKNMQQNKSMSEKYGSNWRMWDEYTNKRQTMTDRDARAAVKGIGVPDSMQKSFDRKISRLNRMFRGRGFNLDLNKGYVPNYAFKRLKTIAQAVGMFKKDTGMFSMGAGNNFWSRKTNSIKLRESNYDDIRQFINSRAFRSLSDTERKRTIKDLREQSNALNMNDVTRGYGQYADPDYRGRIHVSKGLIPNYAKIVSNSAKNILQKSPEYSGAVLDAIKRESSFGVTPKVVSAPSLKSSSNPGLAVVNQEQEGGSLAKARMLHGGLNPKQKSSVPNYALTGSDITNIQYGSDVGKSQLGLTAMEQSFYKAKDAIDLMSVSAGKGRKALDKIATNYARSSQVATESNLRYAAQMGKLEKETPERQNFARQMYRKEALGDMASSGGRDSLLAQDLSKSKDFEKAILDRKEIAQRTGNTELAKSLSRIDRNLDKSAAQLMNQPKTIARSLERNLIRESIDMKRLSKFTGDDGFSKQKAQQFFARQFLQERGINVQDKQQANSIIAAMGKQGAKELGKFMDSQGVKSSNAQLAKAGFGSGELRSLTNKQSSSFVQGFKTLEQKLTSGSVKDRVLGSRTAVADLRREAMRIGKDNASVTALNKKIDDFKKAVQTSSRTADQTSKQNAAQQRIVNAGTGTRGALERFKGSFQMGAAGGRNFAGGSRVGGFLGRAGGFIGSKARDFGSRGVGGFGGQVGLGLSFIAPMLAGIVQNPKSRIDRASFKDGSLQVDGTQSIGDRDVMSSVLMGTGMGAIFGPGGALVGAAAGFVTAMRKTTLSLEEQVQLREKEISLIGQNLQAVGSVQNLSNARVQAFQSGNQDEVNRIDAAINSTLASINDEEILRKVSDAAGDTNALSSVEKILQDRMTVATSGQNFAMAMKNNNVKNAGVAMGSIIAQNIRNGLVDSDVAKDALRNITSNVAQRRKSGELMSVEEMSSLRATASGKGNAFFGDNTTWKKVGTGVGVAAGVALAAILAPFTGGASLAVGAGLLTTVAGTTALGYAGGAMMDQDAAQNRLNEMKELGVNELKELEKLVDAGAMTERTLNFLVAAFDKGKMGIDEIAKEALKSVEQFEKIEKNSAKTATQLFDLDNKFKVAIRNLMTSMEIDKIETKSKIDNQRSTANFVSQFMDQKAGTNFMAKQQSEILAQEIALSLRQFTQESSALLMKDIKTKGKTLNLMPSQTEGLIDLIEKTGSEGVQSMVNERKVGAQYQLKLTPENVGLILKESGLSADGKGLANIRDTSRLAPILQTEDKNQQLNIISSLQKNLQQVKDTGVLDVTFEKKLTNQNAKILQELLDERNAQKEILQANIEAQRKSLQLQLAQNKIQTEISSNLTAIQIRSANRAQQRDIDMINQQSKSERKIASLDFERSEIFRGMNTDEEENERQSKIRKKIFDEEFKLRKQEDLNAFKIEASRLLSEKTLVDALNNLSSTIREELKKQGLVSDTDDTSGIPSQPAPERKRGSAAAQWLKNFEKTGTDMMVGSTSGSSDLKFVPQNKKNAEIQERIKEKSLRVDDLSGQKNVATKNISEAESAKDITRKRLFSLKDAALKLEEGDRKGAEAILSDIGRADMFTPPTHAQYQPWEGAYGSPTFSDKVFDVDLKQKISDEISTKETIFQERGRVLKDYLNQRQKLEEQIQEETEAIKSLETQKTETSTLPEKVNEQSIALEKFDLIKTEMAMIQVDDANSLKEAGSRLSSILEQAKQNNSSGDMVATIESMILLVQKMQAGQKAFSESFRIQEAQTKVDEFLGGLNFGSAAGDSLQRLQVIQNMDGSDVRSQAASNALQNAVMQAQREKAYDVVVQDPSATNLEKAEARLAKNAASFGSKDQRKQMSQFIDEKRDKSLALKDAQLAGNEQAALNLEASIAQLDNSMEQLALQMERSTRRDSQPAYKAFASDFSDGLSAGFADIESRSEGIYSRLGRDLPNAFHTGMVDAMQAAIMGADDMGDVLNNIGYNFLSIIQRAFLESAASRMMGIFGFNNGGYVTGGSGVKDDVPALLTGGEFVMRKSAVDRYGAGFMNSLNQGTVPGFNEGGMVGLNIQGPRAAVREEYEDKNDYGSVTRYKVTRERRGIDRRMSAYAVANDREIQRFMRDEENQFNEDLNTKRQEAYRKAYTKAAKEREAKIEQQKKDNKKKAMRNMLIGIAGAALLNYGMSKASDWYKGTKFGQNRFKSKAQKQLDDKGFITVKGSNGFKDMSPSDEFHTKSFFNRMNKEEGPLVTSNQLNMRGIPAKVGDNKISWQDGGNYGGGMVRAALSGGEYVVNPQAVQAIGTSTLSRINNGSLNPAGAGGTQVTHGDVNVTINVSSDGTTSSSGGGQMGDKEFASKVKGAVLNVIKNERRQGGSLR